MIDLYLKQMRNIEIITHEKQGDESVVQNYWDAYNYNASSSTTKSKEEFLNRPKQNKISRITYFSLVISHV